MRVRLIGGGSILAWDVCPTEKRSTSTSKSYGPTMQKPFRYWSRVQRWFQSLKNGYWQAITRFYVPKSRGKGPMLPTRERRFPWLPYHGVRFQGLEGRSM